MRRTLDSLDQSHFDVVIIGAGINGAAAAKAATDAGYKVGLFDKDDYASGASRQSTRLLHCGLRYLMPGGPLTIFLRHPGRFIDVLKTIRRSMAVRSELVRSEPDRLMPIRMHYPLFRDGPYAPWMVDIAFGILGTLSDGKVPLNYKRSTGRAAQDASPFTAFLQSPERLSSIASYTEYQFDWPERVVVDQVLQAQAAGAVARNHTPVTGLSHGQDGWTVDLGDAHGPQTARIHAKAVFNLSGVWVDRVHALVPAPIKRKVTGTKGAHLVFKLPPACKGHGFAAMSSVGRPFYCMPWRDLHFFGPTETLYEGDPDDVFADEDDIAFLLRETTNLFPKLGLTRKDIVSTWAGVRPLTYDANMPMGHRSRRIYNLAEEGLAGGYALTNGSLGAHRKTAEDLVDELRKFLPPTQTTPTASPAHPADAAQVAPQFSGCAPTEGDEHAVTLEDIMARRTGLVWNADFGLGQVESVAQTWGARLGWDDKRVRNEIDHYVQTVHHLYGVRGTSV